MSQGFRLPGRPRRDPTTGRFADQFQDITLTLSCGQVQWTGKIDDLPSLMLRLIQDVNDLVENGFKRGAERAIDTYSLFVALKTGKMRSVYISDLKKQLLSMERVLIAQGSIIRMRYNLRGLINRVFYALYHIFDFTGVSTYKHPTTPGTKPIDLREMRQLFLALTISDGIKAMLSRGYSLRIQNLEISVLKSQVALM